MAVVRREPWFARIVRDALRIVFGALIVSATGAAYLSPPELPSPWIDRPLRVSIGIMAAMITIAVLRELVPKSTPGSHRVGWDRNYFRWLSSASLVGVALHPIVRFPAWQLYTTRVPYLKLPYAKVAWSAVPAEHFVVREPSLLAVGRGHRSSPASSSKLRRTVRVASDRSGLDRRRASSAHTQRNAWRDIGHGRASSPRRSSVKMFASASERRERRCASSAASDRGVRQDWCGRDLVRRRSRRRSSACRRRLRRRATNRDGEREIWADPRRNGCGPP